MIDLEQLPAPDPFAELENAEQVERAMRFLNPRQREVIELRHVEGRTFKQIGADVGLSVTRVCQIERRALEKMRKSVKA